MNKFEQRSKTSYDKMAKKYDETLDGKFTEKFKKLLCQTVEIADGDTVVDVACGNGTLLNRLKQKCDFRGCGVDISEKMIEEAKRLNPAMEFFVAGCDELPFENEQIDVMTVCAAYHHFPYVDLFVKEAGRVMKRGGSLYIAEIYLPAILRRLCNPFVKLSRSGDVKFYSPEEIASFFEANHFVAKGKTINGVVQIIVLQRV